MQFQEIIALPSRGKHCTCRMSCTGNATSSEQLPKYCKLLIFWQFTDLSASLAIAPCSRVAVFPRDSSAIISENCIAIAGEKKNCSCSLEATFHLTTSIRGQRATGKIQRNSKSCGSSLTGKTSLVPLIFMHGTHRNVKNR